MGIWAHARTTASRNWARFVGVAHVTDYDAHFVPDMLDGVHIRALCWPVHHIYILLHGKVRSYMTCMGSSVVMHKDEIVSEGGPCKW